MGCQKSNFYWGILSLAVCVALVPFSLVTPQVIAQGRFPRLGAPRRTVGGGTRGTPADVASCLNAKPTLTVLSPKNNVVTTISAHPTLFWYVPQTAAQSAEFEILDQQNRTVYQTTLALTGVPGVVKLSLPRTVALETGKEYIWTFTLLCEPDEPNQDLVVQGVIKPTVLSSAQRVRLAATRQPLTQAEIYAQAGVWQERLSLLAQLRRDRPNDPKVNQAWQDLFKSVDLPELANKRLVECCKANQ